MTDYLLDSGFLYASIDESDKQHESVKDVARRIRGNIILPIPAITETAYFLSKNRKIQSNEIERTVLSELEKDEWNEADIEAKEDYRKTFIKSKFLLALSSNRKGRNIFY